MLILTRRAEESLYVGDRIKITVLGIQGKQVRLGIDVPETIPVYREEVYLRIKEENACALAASESDLAAAASLLRITNRAGQNG